MHFVCYVPSVMYMLGNVFSAPRGLIENSHILWLPVCKNRTHRYNIFLVLGVHRCLGSMGIFDHNLKCLLIGGSKVVGPLRQVAALFPLPSV